MTGRGRDVGRASEAQETDSKVAKTGQCAGAVASADLATVFVEGHITHVVDAILDFPVATDEGEELFWGSFGFVKAGNAKTHLCGLFSTLDNIAVQISGNPFDAEHLFDMRKIEVLIEVDACPETTGLEPSMAFVGGGDLRGENPPYGGHQCLPAE